MNQFQKEIQSIFAAVNKSDREMDLHQRLVRDVHSLIIRLSALPGDTSECSEHLQSAASWLDAWFAPAPDANEYYEHIKEMEADERRGAR